MRGAGRIGGKNFKIPKGRNPLPSANPLADLSIPTIGDLPVAPTLEPINDDWSISNFNEPVDPRDCSKYPASPYCDNNFVSTKSLGYEFEVRTNGCETCVYIYPVVLYLKLTPTIICNRRPDCIPDQNPKPEIPKGEDFPQFAEQSPNDWISPVCATLRNIIIRKVNAFNTGAAKNDERTTNYFLDQARKEGAKITSLGAFSRIGGGPGQFAVTEIPFTLIGATTKLWQIEGNRFSIVGYSYITGIFFPPCKDGKNPPPGPPPPIQLDPEPNNRERSKGKNNMCCNECAEANEKTDRLLRDIKEIKKALGTGQLDKALNAAVGIGDGSVTGIVNLIAKRLGTNRYPIEVPESLLTGVGDKVQKVESITDFTYWLTHQLDALIGEFPIDIEIKDIDPLTEGDQKKKVQLPNLAETVAELYGLALKSSVNQEVDQAMLLRLATEVIAVKNGVAITQDYVKANTKFLGYRGNPAARELTYNFDFSSIDLNNKEQTVTIDKILKTTKAYIQGWENEDKDTAQNFFQKLMFSAGIIKAVFFRDKKQVREMGQQAKSMLQDDLDNNRRWKEFLQSINSPNSEYNKNQTEIPEITEEKRDINKP